MNKPVFSNVDKGLLEGIVIQLDEMINCVERHNIRLRKRKINGPLGWFFKNHNNQIDQFLKSNNEEITKLLQSKKQYEDYIAD